MNLKKRLKLGWSKNIKNPYIPKLARIENIKKETNTVKTFRLKFLDKKIRNSFNFIPGQFIQISVFGIGEAPFSIFSYPYNKDFFEVSIRKVGNVTNSLWKLNEGDTVGVRGPYGNGYPMDEFKHKNVVMVAGGIGFPPVKSMIECLIYKREKFGNLWLLYGAKNPDEIVFKEDLEKWSKERNFNVLITVDKGTSEWKGNVGVVTTLFDKVNIPSEDIVGVICGPPIMMKFVVQSLKKLDFKDGQIFLSMERLMQCGIGKCGHCNIGKKYVCLDGPIFRDDELKGLTEEIW